MESGTGDVQLSGTIASDGLFTGKLGGIPLLGKFDENQFQGATQPQAGAVSLGGGAAVFLERVK
jgi:hypothetical protein